VDVVELARLQFAITVSGHFLFVMVTLGLAPLVAIMQTFAVVTGKPVYERMTRFWGQAYLINYALGIVTGLVMEFQFGLNWAGLGDFAGEVFGAPMAMETLVAFAFESVFLGIWIFGWGRLPKVVHLASFWIVTVAAYLSAYFIMVANGFMQRPVGFELVDGHVRLTDLGALMTNDGALLALQHIVSVALLVAGFLVAGGSAWHMLRGTDPDLVRRSMRFGVVTAFLGSWLALITGFGQLPFVHTFQPTKSASIDANTAKLDALQAEMELQYGPGAYTPVPLDVPWQTMQMVGYLLFFFSFGLLVMLFRNWISRPRWLLRTMIWTIPVPIFGIAAGWMIREVGRQPWAVWGHLKVSDAVSMVGATQVLISLVLFSLVFVALIVIDWLLIARSIRRGPDVVLLGSAQGRPAAEVMAETDIIAGIADTRT
jgi:cytochrome d ubiquinol oxidase subunit I